MAKPNEGRSRVVIENVKPELNCGRFPIKRIVGDSVAVEADVFGDGHDQVRARLLWKQESAADWQTMEMRPLGNDRWRVNFLSRKSAATATPWWVKSIISEPGAATSRSG